MIRALASCLLLPLLIFPAFARSKSAPPRLDPDYVSALAAANSFLHAWQTRDQETAILLLTDRLKQNTDDSILESLWRGATPPRSFEISRGTRLAPGRYRFPVSLFASPLNISKTRPQTSAIIVVKAGKSDWAIDKLP